VGQTEFDVISVVQLRRQTGVCPTCYASILADSVARTCPSAINVTGCRQTYALTTNNVLTTDSGALFLCLHLAFNSETSYIELGGVRLTLEHD
jgi:hypothetical protein